MDAPNQKKDNPIFAWSNSSSHHQREINGVKVKVYFSQGANQTLQEKIMQLLTSAYLHSAESASN